MIYRTCYLTIVAAISLSAAFAGILPAAAADNQLATFTHKQVRFIQPEHNGKPIELNTFCLDKSGNILACVGGDTVEYVAAEDGSFETKTISSPKLLQTYSPDGKLLHEVSLDFKPTAVNQAPNGTIFVAGSGRIANVSSEGKLLLVADSPHLGDLAEMKKKAEEAAKVQMDQLTGSLTAQIERLDTTLTKLKEKPAEELTDRDKLRLKTLQEQKQMYCDQEKEMQTMYSSYFSADAMLERVLEITSMAVTSKDVFLCCGSSEGHGYEVWRTNHELSSPKKVVDSLGGCCGQCDIQANEDHLILAENTKFQVGLLNRDGERVTSFGQQDRTSQDGFGSCCNPMNVRCCSNGDILTAESSIGYIKRFDSEGKFLGTVGKAKIGGGCKHVAIGFDEKRDHYYIQYEDRNQICVMVPLSGAPEFTEDELAAKQAREGLAQKLVGDGKTLSGAWSLTGEMPVAASGSQPGGIFGLITQVFGTDDSSEESAEVSEEEQLNLGMEQATLFKFSADGKLEMSGGYFEGGDNSWEAVRQDLPNNTVTFAQLQDGIQYYDYQVKFIDDNTATFSMMYGQQVMGSVKYKRVPLHKTSTIPATSATTETAKDE